jgi:hypothetical protein
LKIAGGRSFVEIGFVAGLATTTLRVFGFVSEGNESSPLGSVEHPTSTLAQRHKTLRDIARLVDLRFVFMLQWERTSIFLTLQWIQRTATRYTYRLQSCGECRNCLWRDHGIKPTRFLPNSKHIFVDHNMRPSCAA